MKGLRRSFQFVPGSNPGMLQNADILGADSVIFDLEDAVALSEKDSARLLLAGALATFDYSKIEVMVRVNPVDTANFGEDIKVLAHLPVDGLLIPKATLGSMRQAIAHLDAAGFQGSILPLIETALGVEEVFDILRLDPRIDGLLLGGEDLTLDLGVVRTKGGNEINYARNRVVSAGRAMKITCIDTPFTDAEDLEGLREDTRYAKSLGFSAKASINPRHLPIIHEELSPSAREIKYALRVMDAVAVAQQEHKGVFSLDGRMVDAPVISRAAAVVETANRLGLVKEGAYVGKDS